MRSDRAPIEFLVPPIVQIGSTYQQCASAGGGEEVSKPSSVHSALGLSS